MPPRAAPEAQLQRGIVKACKQRWPGISIMASASGAHLAGGARAGALMRQSGVEAGDPDLHIREWGRNGEPSAYVELKVPGGVVRDNQLRQHTALRRRGCAVFVLHSEAEFLSTIAEYLPPDFEAADVEGNTERGSAAATRSRADRREELLADADGGGQHSERGVPEAPADAGSSTDVTVVPDPGSSADAPIDLDLEPELRDAGAESEVGAVSSSMPSNGIELPVRVPAWEAMLLEAGQEATETEVPPPEVDDWDWDYIDYNDWSYDHGTSSILDDHGTLEGYGTP